MWRCLLSATLAPGLRWQMRALLSPTSLSIPCSQALGLRLSISPFPSEEEDVALRLRRRKGQQTLEPGKRFSVEKLSICRGRDREVAKEPLGQEGRTRRWVSQLQALCVCPADGQRRNTPLSPDRAPKFISLLIPLQSPAVSLDRAPKSSGHRSTQPAGRREALIGSRLLIWPAPAGSELAGLEMKLNYVIFQPARPPTRGWISIKYLKVQERFPRG